jgi:hypothetical protein
LGSNKAVRLYNYAQYGGAGSQLWYGSVNGLEPVSFAIGPSLDYQKSVELTYITSSGRFQIGGQGSTVGNHKAINFYVRGVERMTLTGSNVGIGSTRPQEMLTVEASSSNWISKFENYTNSSSVYLLSGSGNGVYIDTGNNADSSKYALNVNKQGSTYMEIRGDGYVGIGAAPSTTGQVYIHAKNGSTAHLSVASGVSNGNSSNFYSFVGWWGIYFNSPSFNGGETGLYRIPIYY